MKHPSARPPPDQQDACEVHDEDAAEPMLSTPVSGPDAGSVQGLGGVQGAEGYGEGAEQEA